MSSDEADLIRLANRIIDIKDVHEILDETKDSITLVEYFNGETKVITLTGDDAQAMKAWLDADHQRWVAYEESKGNPVSDKKRPFYNADLYADIPVIADERDIPF